MRLHTAGMASGFRKPLVVRVTMQPLSVDRRKNAALVLMSHHAIPASVTGYAAIIVHDKIDDESFPIPIVHSVRNIDHLKTGHVVALEPLNGFVRTLYRPESPHNTLFVTERCNSNCLMCSQPPSDTDDAAALTERNLKLIDLMLPAPEYLCLTGGEPTLLGSRLLLIMSKLREVIPESYIHMLTNGRRFAWPDFASDFAAVRHPNFSVGIPLYADHAALHDYVVQARDAFDQTVLGLHQLARHGIEIEIRVVLHALTIPRLSHVAEYICRNLTFVNHVAFMGMEHIGYAPRNMSELWIDPVDYQDELEKSVSILSRFGIDVRIYNLQLCLLKQSLWKYSKQSISDWKNAYDKPCESCEVRSQCGGFFQWATKIQSRGIHPMKSDVA
jgi:His-Xaa-Ser system radical SAM maturase HxsC